MIRALLFDFDGLIIDTESAIYQAWRELYADHGHPLPIERWSQCVGTDFGAYNPKADLEKLTGKDFDWHNEVAMREQRVNELLTGFDALPGVRERLDEAAALGLPCSLASSSPLTWIEPWLDKLEHLQPRLCGEDQAGPRSVPPCRRQARCRAGRGDRL